MEVIVMVIIGVIVFVIWLLFKGLECAIDAIHAIRDKSKSVKLEKRKELAREWLCPDDGLTLLVNILLEWDPYLHKNHGFSNDYLCHYADVFIVDASRIINNFTSHPQQIRVAIAAMVSRLGVANTRKFTNMLTAIEDKNYSLAREILLCSKWAGKEHEKAWQIAKIIEASYKDL